MVAIALVGSLTVLPAVLAKLGDRVESGRIPFLARRRAKDGDSRFWGAVVGAVMRRPVVCGGRGLRRSWSPSRSPRSACTRSTRARRACRATCR